MKGWRSGARGVGPIFIGITLALVFEDWNEERVERMQDVELLAQILRDLRAAHRELTTDGHPGLQAQQTAHEQLIEKLDGSEPPRVESVASDLDVLLNHGFRFYPQAAGYRSLLTIGVDLISNDRLRFELVLFYEGALPRVAEAEDDLWKSYDRFLHPYVFEHFQTDERQGELIIAPREVDTLKSAQAFRLILRRLAGNRRRLSSQYGRAEAQSEAPIQSLEGALAR
jgi:hypothetical protein